jgi:hypothetical protein
MSEDEVVYDVEEAARVVSERSGLQLADAENILEAEFLFQATLGAFDIPDDEEGQEFMNEIRQLREAHADLVPAVDEDLDRIPDLEDRAVTFISRLTGSEPSAIEEALDEHILYLEERGLIDVDDEEG